MGVCQVNTYNLYFMKTEENVVWEGKMNTIILNQIADYGCVSGEHLLAGFMKTEENVV